MSRTRTTLVAALLLLGIVGMTSVSVAIHLPIRVFEYELDPLEVPQTPGPVDLKFSFSLTELCRGCDEVTLTVTTEGGLGYSGPEAWTVRVDKDVPYSTLLRVDIPPDDTSMIVISMRCGRFSGRARKWFTSTSDSVKVWNGNPRGYQGVSKEPTAAQELRAKLTPEQLQAKVTISVDLRGSFPGDIKLVKRLLGPLPATDHDSVYIFRTTKDNMLKLWHRGVNWRLLEREPSPPPAADSVSEDELKPDTLREEGALDGTRNPDSDGAILLERVTGMTSPGYLPTNTVITFYLRLNNDTWLDMAGIMNGFQVYSPDGAEWTGTVGDTLGTLAWKDRFDLTYAIQYSSATGFGADTVGFGGARMFSTGLPWWFNDTAYSITIGPMDNMSIGRTICLDSCYFPPAGTWKWVVSGGFDFYPTWDGPHCYEIVPDEITFWGNLYYLDPVPPDTDQVPMRTVTIQMWDQDQIPYVDQLLASDVTDDYGYFSLGPVSNHDSLGDGGQDVYFTVLSENDAAWVTKNLAGDRYEFKTSVDTNVIGGSHYTSIVCPLSKSGPFFVADIVLDGLRKWQSLTSAYFCGKAHTVLCADSASTGYNPSADYIFINDSIDDIHQLPDTWDRSTILHEYGHRLAYCLNFFDASSGGAHHLCDIISTEFAASEGFAHFWSALTRNDPFRVYYWNDFADSGWTNWENGEFGVSPDPVWGSINARGPENEGAVAGMLWDIFDTANDDYSDSTDWLTLNLGPHPDGIGDSLSDGPDNVLTALVEGYVDGHHPDNIDEFWEAWFDQAGDPGNGHSAAMVDIWYEHGAPVSDECCIGIRGNVDGDPDDEIDIADMVFLIDYMFAGGPVPACFDEANVDGEVMIDIADLVFLIDYMFAGGPAPPPCG